MKSGLTFRLVHYSAEVQRTFSKIRRKIYFSADCKHGWNFKAFALRFWRNILKMKKESTWWAPHLLIEEQKHTHVRMAHKLLKQFQIYDQKLFMSVVTDVESLMHYFEPQRKIINQIWLIFCEFVTFPLVSWVRCGT